MMKGVGRGAKEFLAIFVLSQLHVTCIEFYIFLVWVELYSKTYMCKLATLDPQPHRKTCTFTHSK